MYKIILLKLSTLLGTLEPIDLSPYQSAVGIFTAANIGAGALRSEIENNIKLLVTEQNEAIQQIIHDGDAYYNVIQQMISKRDQLSKIFIFTDYAQKICLLSPLISSPFIVFACYIQYIERSCALFLTLSLIIFISVAPFLIAYTLYVLAYFISIEFRRLLSNLY